MRLRIPASGVGDCVQARLSHRFQGFMVSGGDPVTQPQRGRTELQVAEKPWRVVHTVQNGGKQPMERPWPACEFRPTLAQMRTSVIVPQPRPCPQAPLPTDPAAAPSLLSYLRGLPQGRPRISLPTLWGFFPSKFRVPIALLYLLLTKRRARRRARGRPRPDGGRAKGPSLSPHRRRLRPLRLVLLAGGCKESEVPRRGPQSCLPPTRCVHPSSLPATCPCRPPPPAPFHYHREKSQGLKLVF